MWMSIGGLANEFFITLIDGVLLGFLAIPQASENQEDKLKGRAVIGSSLFVILDLVNYSVVISPNCPWSRW